MMWKENVRFTAGPARIQTCTLKFGVDNEKGREKKIARSPRVLFPLVI